MNKIAIVMPTYNRPQYLKQVLAGLKKSENIEKFFIVTSEEPNIEISNLFDQVDFIEIKRNKNSVKLGCNNNVIKAINLGFTYSDKIVVLEDDIVPGKDFLNYFLWGFSNINPGIEIISLSAYNRIKDEGKESDVNIVRKRNHFTPWGWGTWKEVWERLESGSKFLGADAAWDTHFSNLIKQKNLYEIYPIIGRSNNIGEVGTYVPSPEWQRNNQFCPYWIDSLNLNPIKNFTF